MKAFEVIRADRAASPVEVGNIVQEKYGYDYGLAADDTAMTGIRHISVVSPTEDASFTIPVEDLKEVDIPPPTDAEVKSLCKIGQGDACCRYLTMGSDGWGCAKLSRELRKQIDERVTAGTMNAKGDNCSGKGTDG